MNDDWVPDEYGQVCEQIKDRLIREYGRLAREAAATPKPAKPPAKDPPQPKESPELVDAIRRTHR